jgi:hypothetical protein
MTTTFYGDRREKTSAPVLDLLLRRDPLAPYRAV